MDSLLTDVNWMAVVVGAIVSYSLGALWYSEKMFVTKWLTGLGTPAVPNRPMLAGMVTQALGTFLLAWVIGVAETTNSLYLVILITITISTLIKANGLFGGKNNYAIAVESSFILVMTTVMLLAHAIL